MGCCTAIENFIKNPIGSIEDFFDGEDIQSVGVSMQPIVPLSENEPNGIMSLRKKAKAFDSSIAQEMTKEYVTGRFARITNALRYLRNGNGLDGEAKFKVLGDTENYRNFLFDTLATESGVVGATASDVSMNHYSDSITATTNMLAYKYLKASSGYYGAWNNDNIFSFTEVIDTAAIDFTQSEPQIQMTTDDVDIGSSNETVLASSIDLKVVNIWIMNKVTVSDPNTPIQIIVIELEDTATGDIYYHELRPLSMTEDDDNQLLVHYGITGSDCCYYYMYQFGSNVHPELEDATSQTVDDSYSTFSMFPIITLKHNGDYVADMKVSNNARYMDAKRICKKIGVPLKYLDAMIKERGTTPAENAQADSSHSQTKDTFLEYGLNIDRNSNSNAKALWLTAKLIKDYTTSQTVITEDGQTDESYAFSISHDNTTVSRYNKNIKIGNINVSTHVGTYSIRESDTESEQLKNHKYSREKFLVNNASELLADGSNGEKDYQIVLNEKSHYDDYKSVLRLVHQDGNNYTIYDIESIVTYSTIIDGGNSKGIEYNMLDTFTFSDHTGTMLTLPLFAEIVNHMNYTDQYALYNESMHILNFASVVTHLAWYETGIFIKIVQIVLVVVSVVILVGSLGSGTEISAYLISIAIGLSASMALQYLLTKVNNPWLKAIIVIAYVAVMYTTGQVNTDKDITMLLATSAIKAVEIDYMQEMQHEAERYKKFTESLNSEMRQLEQKQKDIIKPKSIDATDIIIEDVDNFYDRVLNIDIIESVEALSDDFMDSDMDKYLDLYNMYTQK